MMALCAVVKRGHKRAGRAQHVKHDARGRAQIALGERGQFRRRQDGFNFHFASRKGREKAAKGKFPFADFTFFARNLN